MADRTLVDIVRSLAEHRPEAAAMCWIPELSRDPAQSIDRATLLAGSERIGGALAQLDWPAGRRLALLAFPPGLGFIRAFLGCLLAGVVPVPVALPRHGRSAPVLEAIVANCGARLALSTAAEDARLRELFAHSPVLAPVRVVALESLPAGAPPPRVAPHGADLAFVQYTSGSSSHPKGVCVSHANLVANLELIHRCFAMTADDVVVSWLPHYHDMGLIGSLLVPLHDGVPSVAMAPSAFVKRPLRWLELISAQDPQRRVVSGGPNFAYQLCVDRIDAQAAAQLSLARWQTAFNGAEPVRAATVKAFTERFAPAGFAPTSVLACYGLAETTLFAAGGHAPAFTTACADALADGRIERPAGPAPARELVASGPAPAERIAIVDRASRRRLPEGAVGEIWITGPSVPRGYLDDPVETARTFHASIEGDASGTRWLATGDLGAVVDGWLYVTGRARELLIVHGRNVYPHDVEALLLGADARVEGAAVFAWEEPGATTESAVAVCELARGARTLLAGGAGAQAQLERLADALRRAAAQAEVPIAHLRFVGPLQIARTTSGKTAYGQLRRGFAALPAPLRSQPWSAATANRPLPGEEHDAVAELVR